MSEFKLLADEHIAGAVIDQLNGKDVDIRRVIDILPEGTPDPDLLEFAHENGYALLTHDEHITRHLAARQQDGKAHGGVFIAGQLLQGKGGIGTIVKFIAEYNELIEGGAATVQGDVYNQIIYI